MPPTIHDFPFAHNWTDPVVERLSYLTAVYDAHTDYEQRQSLRPVGPRRTFEYLFTPSSANARARFHAVTFKAGVVYKVPIWHDARVITSAVSAGTTSFSFNTEGYGYEEDSYLCLWRSPSEYEFKQIDSVTDSSVTLAAGTSNGWAADGQTVIAPAVLATLANEQQIKSYAADWEDVPLQFDVLESELYTPGIPDVPAAHGLDEYRGRKVLNVLRSRYAFKDEGRRYGISRAGEAVLDNETGLRRAVANDTGHRRTIPFSVVTTIRPGNSSANGFTIASLRETLNAFDGRRVPLWVYTGERDFEAVSVSGSNLTVSGVGYPTLYAQHQSRRDIAVLKTDGSRSYHRINSSSASGSNDVLTLDSAPPAVSTIERVSFLRPCRLASDEIELKFHRREPSTGGVVLEADLAFKEILTTPSS